MSEYGWMEVVLMQGNVRSKVPVVETDITDAVRELCEAANKGHDALTAAVFTIEAELGKKFADDFRESEERLAAALASCPAALRGKP